MISVVIPTLDAEACLPDTLSALIPATVDGLVREVIVVDGGSHDRTRDIADAAGAEVIVSEAGPRQPARRGRRARQASLAAVPARRHRARPRAGSARPRSSWSGSTPASCKPAAAAFRFALDDDGLAPRCLEGLVRLRCLALGLPYGDQGLLIPRRLYDEVGGYRELPLMEDVDLVRRLGRAPREAFANSRRDKRAAIPARGLPAAGFEEPDFPHALRAQRSARPHLAVVRRAAHGTLI